MLYTPPTPAPPPAFVDGRTHVLVTTGTHLPWRRAEMLAAVRVAARMRPGIEFHVSDGDRTSGRQQIDGNVQRLGFVSYDRDLSRYAAIVHHGGAGIMYRTLAAGLPAVVIPSDYDQFDHAARLDRAGVAVWAKWSRLGPGLDRALADAEMRVRCTQLQNRLSSIDTGGAITELVLGILTSS
jgi:UDP:flavonoid glycosyltransferase YjiC (YdhE family)